MIASGTIPDETLPDGWAPTGDGLVFKCPTSELVAGVDRQREDAAGTTGAPCGWEVWYERRAGEATERQTVGAVTTRDAAVDALLSCMRRVSGEKTAESDTPVDGRWTALSTLAEGVTLRDSIPAAADGEGGVDAASYARSWVTKLDE